MPPEDYEKRKLDEMIEKVKYYSNILKDIKEVEYTLLQKQLAKNLFDYVEKYSN